MLKFSLLIATLNRPRELRQCVEKLLGQTYSGFEIIIVDQSDKECCDESIKEMDDRIQYMHISEKGLSHARNVGLQYVCGDYVCLVDDDGLFEDDVLEIASSIIQQYHPAVLGGIVQDPITGVIKGSICDHVTEWKTAFKYHNSLGMIIETTFLKCHKFDEKFGIGAKYGSGEESDIVLCALSEGKMVYSTNRYTTYHRIGGVELGKVAHSKLEKYSFGYGALCRKTLKKYSKFWGGYYFAKTVMGNSILWILQSLRGNKDEASARKIRAQYTVKGFFDYK